MGRIDSVDDYVTFTTTVPQRLWRKLRIEFDDWALPLTIHREALQASELPEFRSVEAALLYDPCAWPTEGTVAECTRAVALAFQRCGGNVPATASVLGVDVALVRHYLLRVGNIEEYAAKEPGVRKFRSDEIESLTRTCSGP